MEKIQENHSEAVRESCIAVSSMHQESSRKRYRIAALQAKSENQGGTVHNAPLGSNTQGCFLFENYPA